MITFFPSQVTESGRRGFIFHYEDVMTPRAFDGENTDITLLWPGIRSCDMYEMSPIHSLMLIRVKMHTMSIDFDVDTPIVRVNWEE